MDTSHLVIRVGEDLRFVARLELALAFATCRAFVAALPFERQLVQARWSGEAGWIPLGDTSFGVPLENATSSPAAGHILMYPGGRSETEILFPYGSTRFASKYGQLSGSHFLTVVEGAAQYERLGFKLLWCGAQAIRFEIAG